MYLRRIFRDSCLMLRYLNKGTIPSISLFNHASPFTDATLEDSFLSLIADFTGEDSFASWLSAFTGKMEDFLASLLPAVAGVDFAVFMILNVDRLFGYCRCFLFSFIGVFLISYISLQWKVSPLINPFFEPECCIEIFCGGTARGGISFCSTVTW